MLHLFPSFLTGILTENQVGFCFKNISGVNVSVGLLHDVIEKFVSDEINLIKADVDIARTGRGESVGIPLIRKGKPRAPCCDKGQENDTELR